MLGLSSPARPLLAYGFWRYSEDEIDKALAMLALAREHGIDHLDTADVYGGRDAFGSVERLLGVLRKRAPSLFEGAGLATKAGAGAAPYNSSAQYLTAACDASLARLGVERIDLFYVHRHDLLTHPADLAATLDGLLQAGKVGAIGVSNFTPAQIDALNRWLKTPIAAHQFEFSAAHVAPISDGSLDQVMREGFHALAWSPLAGGRLMQGVADAALAPVRGKLEELARRYQTSPEAIAIAFILRHPAGVTPILGAKSPQHLRACLDARSLELSRTDWYAILEARLGYAMP